MKLLNPLPQRLDTGATPTFAGLLAGDGTAAAPSISFAADTDTGFYRLSTGLIGVTSDGTSSLRLGLLTGGGFIQGNAAGAGYIHFTSTSGVSLVAQGTNQNITLTPSGTGAVCIGLANASPLALLEIGAVGGGSSRFLDSTTGESIYVVKASGTGTGLGFLNNAQASIARLLNSGRFLLGTTNDSVNGILQLATHTTSAGGIGFGPDVALYRINANFLALDTTGSSPSFALRSASTDIAYFKSSGATVTLASVGGQLILQSNNTTALTLDSSQNATFAGSVTAGAAANFTFSGRSYISSPSDGIIRLLNNAGTDFTRLQFGGTTASFPALARSGTNLLVVDATGGSYTPILASNFWATGPAVTVSAGNVSYGATTATTVGAAGGASLLPATPLGYIIVNVSGTAAKIPYYNA